MNNVFSYRLTPPSPLALPTDLLLATFSEESSSLCAGESPSLRIKEADETKAREAFKALEPELMRGVSKNIFKLNTASRKLQRLSASIRKLKAVKN